VDTRKLLNFLQDLQQNNAKDWMDANRSRYHKVRDEFLNFIDGINAKLVKTYPQYHETPAKKAIERINNNLMFHPISILLHFTHHSLFRVPNFQLKTLKNFHWI